MFFYSIELSWDKQMKAKSVYSCEKDIAGFAWIDC